MKLGTVVKISLHPDAVVQSYAVYALQGDKYVMRFENRKDPFIGTIVEVLPDGHKFLVSSGIVGVYDYSVLIEKIA